ncbi:hypothetical protein ACHAXR_009510 [Thalassiosira sp. AJA248-18]
MGARCAVSADFDGDGWPTCASSNDNAVSWFRNEGGNPTPTFSIKKKITWSSLGSRIVTVGDVDGDGDVDAVGASYYDSSLRWFENIDGAGVFMEHMVSDAVDEGQGVTLADIDNDGDPDIIAASSGDNTIAVFKNIDHGIFCEIKEVVDANAIGARTVIAVDLNGDGWLDLASASKDDDSVSWYPNDRTGHFPQKITISAGNESLGAYSLVAVDIDGDFDQDLIVASNGNNHVSIWRNDGLGNFSKTLVFDDAEFVLSVTAADFDRDGDIDIASASFFDGHINWYENLDGNGYEWRNHTIYIGMQGHYVHHGDMDGDGDIDLIAVDAAENSVTIFFAKTDCDGNDTGNECCLEGSQWNGTDCERCPMGTYGIGTRMMAACVECPQDQCTIPGRNPLPTACRSMTWCANVKDSLAACSCGANTDMDPKTDSCMACPEGQTRPDVGKRGMDTLGNYTAWEMQQLRCAVPEKELPPPDYNYLTGIRPLGYMFVAISMLWVFVCVVWTQKYIETRVVKASQPEFLRLICVGCLIMVGSIIPLSVDDSFASPERCSRACMAFPWLLSFGFTTTFAALFSKIWRLAKAFRAAQQCRRIRVRFKDAMIPFISLMTPNCVLMLIWNLIDPLVWVRTELDESNQSRGYCSSKGDASIVFAVLILIVNLGALILANVQAFRARKITLEDFSESTYVFLTMGSLLQSLIICAPLLALVHENNVTTYFLLSAMIFIVSTTILGLMFIPKMLLVRKREQDSDRQEGVSSLSLTRVSLDHESNTEDQNDTGAFENQGFAAGTIQRWFGQQTNPIVVLASPVGVENSGNRTVATGTF